MSGCEDGEYGSRLSNGTSARVSSRIRPSDKPTGDSHHLSREHGRLTLDRLWVVGLTDLVDERLYSQKISGLDRYGDTDRIDLRVKLETGMGRDCVWGEDALSSHGVCGRMMQRMRSAKRTRRSAFKGSAFIGRRLKDRRLKDRRLRTHQSLIPMPFFVSLSQFNKRTSLTSSD